MSSDSITAVNRVQQNIANIDLNPEDLPAQITTQINKVKLLQEKVQNAVAAAKNAGDAANKASGKSAKWGIFKDYKKEAIEELQTAGSSLAEAVQISAEAHELSFEFQEELAKISKFLFMLGASNIANNRIVVRELELKLKGASEEEISELARIELLAVVRQLKEQEDLQKKQENISKRLNDYGELLTVESQKREQIEEEIEKHANIDIRHDAELLAQAETDKRHDAELHALYEANKLFVKHFKELTINIKKLQKQKKFNILAFVIATISLGISLFQLIF